MIVLLLWLAAIFAYWVWMNKQQKSTEPPMSPGGWPLIGHAPLLIGDSRYLWKQISEVAENSYSIGGVVAASIGPRTVYMITDPDDAFTVANTCFQKDNFYDFAKPWIGEGLVTGTLSIWKQHRKLLNPAFSQIVLDGFLGVFNKQSRKLVKNLSQHVGNGPFDHWIHTKHNALETICLTALGVDFSDHTILNSEYVDATEQMFSILVERFQKFWLHSPYTYKFSSLKRKQDGHLKILHKMSNTVLQLRKLAMNGNIQNNNEKFACTKFKPFMDLLLELAIDKGVLNDREIREHIDTMIVGGHDTSANVLMYTLLLLGSHPRVQEKAYAELQEIFQGSDRDVEKSDLSQMVYIEAILKESMRIFSIVPVVARRLDRNVKLKNCTLKSGRTCFIFVFGVHRHPVWGPDSHEFKPERWLDPATLPETPNAFAGFSIGRRMCIGKTYALMSMKTTLSHLIRNYTFQGDHTKVVLKIDVMLKPDSGYYISVEKRH